MPNTPDPWTAAMLHGDFAAAWAVCDRVLAERLANDTQCSDWPRHEQFVWRGQQLANRRVLVRCYHGLGDTLQFIRFAGPLRRIAREVTVWVQPELLTVVATVPGVDRVSAIHDGKPEFLYDVDIESMELPYALRVTGESIGSHVPYIFPRMRSHVPAPSGDALRVGIAWRSGNWAPERCIPIAELHRIQQVEGVELYSLQYPAENEEREAIGAIDLACKEIELLASRMQKLDLIITVDTYIAHLAGALGLPVWTMLPGEHDWRWMQNRSDSPWYPSMRLLRQPQPGNWRAVIDELLPRLQHEVFFRHHGVVQPAGMASDSRLLGSG